MVVETNCICRVRLPPLPHFVYALTRKPCSHYFQIFAVCILALGNLPCNFFFVFFSFINKIQDGPQNLMSLSRACKCNSVETAQPRERTTNPDIVMPECYASSQRVDSLARVVNLSSPPYTHPATQSFMDLFRVWFKGKTLPWPCAEKLLV